MSDSSRKFLRVILAIIIAIGGWTYVIYNFYPNTDVTYRNIPITFEGESELANRGLGITVSDTETINVTLNQRRVSTGRISSDNITVVADVSDAVEGDNGISLRISGPDGTTVSKSSTRLITVTVEKIKTVDLDVSVEFSDATDLGAEPIVTDLSVETATVAGAASEMDSVDRVVAYISISEMSENARNFTRELVAVDEDGNILPHMVIYPSSISFEASSGYTKSVTLNVNVTGDDTDGYIRTYEIPDNIIIKGSAEDIANITEIETKTIDLSDAMEETEIVIEYNLPEGIYISNSNGIQVLRVTSVEEEKTEDDSDE